MRKNFRWAAIIVAAGTMTGCLEVEDTNSNKELANAIQEQNDILSKSVEPSLTINGVIENMSSAGSVSNAQLQFKVGNQLLDTVSVNSDGSFEIMNFPFSSDYTLVVSSSDNSFLRRAIYGTTRSNASSTGTIFQDLGTISVSDSEIKEISILNSESNESVAGLTLYSYSHSVRPDRQGTVSGKMDFALTSTYDEIRGVYSIALPVDMSASIQASLDLDNDGDNDIYPESNQYISYSDESSLNQLYIHHADIGETGTIFVNDLENEAAKELQLRISALDEDTQSMEDIEFLINDPLNGQQRPVFDETTSQYIFDTQLNGSVRVVMPAFTIGNEHYQSGYVNVERYGEEQMRLTTMVPNRWGDYTTASYLVPLDSSVLDIVLQVNKTNGQPTIEVVLKDDDVEANGIFSVFYSQAVGMNSDSTQLIQYDKVSVTRGNDDANDLVLAGTTIVSEDDVEVPHTVEMSLNNTRMVITPDNALEQGYNYSYLVGEITEVAAGLVTDISDDHSDMFNVPHISTGAFDINSLKLDNNNYYTNGVIINAANTAGEASTYPNGASYTNLILPIDVADSLDYLMLRKVIITNNGTPQANVNTYTIIENGTPKYGLSTSYAVSLAENETFVRENGYSYNFFHGLNYQDGKLYIFQIGDYLDDNTSGNENSATFEYAFETKEGVVETGAITLPVQ